MRKSWVSIACAFVLLLVIAPPVDTRARQAAAPRTPTYRTLEDRFVVNHPKSLAEWRTRAAWLKEHILATAGLHPMPERAPLNAVVFGERMHENYSVSKVYFESLPGFLVTGNLYRPVGSGPFPAIVSPHGHWTYGRLENSAAASVPGRAINLARQGFVVFTYDMIGYNDSRRYPHNPNHTYHDREFGGRRENLWGLSLGGTAALEQHPRASISSRSLPIRRARSDRRDGRLRRRHADVPAVGRRRPRSRQPRR